jgi:hypothetical protein
MLEPFNETTCAQPAAARSNSSGELRHQQALKRDEIGLNRHRALGL